MDEGYDTRNVVLVPTARKIGVQEATIQFLVVSGFGYGMVQNLL